MSEEAAVRLYGEARAPREPIRACAGPLRFVFEDGMVKHVRFGHVELVRRVYFGVRTDDWDTIYPVLSDVDVEAAAETFQARFAARCRGKAVDYAWTGTIEADADGTIRFSVEGEPQAGFGSNRIGLCMLLGARSLAGQPFTLTKADGGREDGTFPPHVDPDLVAAQFRAIRYRPPSGPLVECDMHGAVFDMEDQRLYMDTTYKAYAPLPYAYPQVGAGERACQTWTLRLAEPPASVEVVAPDAPVTVEVGGRIENARIPGLGLTLDPSARLTDAEVADLAAMRLAHLRLELNADDPGCEAFLAEALPVAAEITAGLLLSVRNLNEATIARLTPMVALVADSPIERLAVEACEAKPGLLGAIRQAVQSDRLAVRVGGPGSDAVSAHPDIAGWAAARPDFLCWAGSPAIHQEDDETLMENTAGIAEQFATAHMIAEGVPLAAGPFQLNGAWPRPRPDPRHTGLFGATWAASLVKHMAESSAVFATLFAAVGPAGVLYRRAPFAQPGFDGTDRRRYPVYDCLAWFSTCGGAVLRADSSDPLRIEALAMSAERADADPLVLLINKTCRPQTVRLYGAGGPRRMCVFTGQPREDPGRGTPGRPAAVCSAGELSSPGVALPPYGLAWLVDGVDAC